MSQRSGDLAHDHQRRHLRQRYQGVKNEAGVWVTPAFPKLIYVLEEDNIEPKEVNIGI